MNKDIYSFYELVQTYEVKVPILQRDYAQGRQSNEAICKTFLKALKESIVENKTINLDFIYGNVDGDVFLPLDGQQRLTTLFLLHWYACEKEKAGENHKNVLKRFSYETRLSSRRFCESLLGNSVLGETAQETVSSVILDSKWFYLSWKNDPTIRAMLNTIDWIHTMFQDVDGLWSALVERKNVVFHLLVLENFGLSDDLYIKMNARGRLLTPFENLKAEIQDKSLKEGWEESEREEKKFAYKIDGEWTDFLWRDYNKNNSVDNAHMNFITTLIMTTLSTGQLVKGAERNELIRKMNFNNSLRELVHYIDRETFQYITKAYDCYSSLAVARSLPSLDLPFWSHTPKESFLNQILVGSNTSYSNKVLFYAQTQYLLSNETIQPDALSDWMRVVRNIVSRADLTPDGKRSDIVRSPEAFNGAIALVNELSAGSGDIYAYLNSASILSTFAKEQVLEEVLKAKIIHKYPEHKSLLHRTEDNDLLRGRITFALECAGYQSEIDQIDFGLLEKVQMVFQAYFNEELEDNKPDFDKLRRAMLTMEVHGQYKFYNYWWSYWYAAEIEKRKLFTKFRELEYFIGLSDYKMYFQKLVIALTESDYDGIIASFELPDSMDNWQYRLIKEPQLLAKCSSKYIAIASDRSYCYLMKGKRPSDTNGSSIVK